MTTRFGATDLAIPRWEALCAPRSLFRVGNRRGRPGDGNGSLALALFRMTTLVVHKGNTLERILLLLLATLTELARLKLSNTFRQLGTHFSPFLVFVRNACEAITAGQVKSVLAVTGTPLGVLARGKVTAHRTAGSVGVFDACHISTARNSKCAFPPLGHAGWKYKALFALIWVGNALGVATTRNVVVEAITPRMDARWVSNAMATTVIPFFANSSATAR